MAGCCAAGCGGGAGATAGAGATVVDTGFSSTGFEEQAATATSAAANHGSDLMGKRSPARSTRKSYGINLTPRPGPKEMSATYVPDG